MSLSTDIQNAAESAFEAISDLLELVTYYSRSNPAYTPSSGVVTNTDSTYSVNMLFLDYEKHEIDGTHVRATDQKAMIPTNNLTPTATTKDRILRANGTYVDIVNVKKDPAGAVWELQTRQ